MRLHLLFILFLPFIFFYILGPYSFVSTFDTLENYLPIYKFIYSSNINNIDFSLGINSGEPFLAYGWYPWIQILFFKILPLSYAYQIVLFIFLVVNSLGTYLLLKKCFLLNKNVVYFFTLLSSLILLRTASLDIGHLVCSSLLIWIIYLFLNQDNLKINLFLTIFFSLIVSGLIHIQYIPVLFIYIGLFSIIFFGNIKKLVLFFIISSFFVILIRSPELISIYNNLGSSGRSISNVNFSILYILIEHLAPVIDLYFLKIRSYFFIILLIFSLVFIKYNKNFLSFIFFILTIILISILNIIFVDKVFLLDKLRIYSILSFFPNMVLFFSAYLINNYFLVAKKNSKKIILGILSFFFIIQTLFYNFDHLISWLYHGNLKSINSNPHIQRIADKENSNFRVATYGYFTNFPLYYGLESIGGYAPVSVGSSRDFWNDFNEKALQKFPSLRDTYENSFNNNTFLNLFVSNYSYNFDEIFDLKKLGDRNTKYIISREIISSKDLKLIYKPKSNMGHQSFTDKLLSLVKSNFIYHDNFYIYKLKSYRDRIFATDQDKKLLYDDDKIFDYVYQNNKYLIDININENHLIFLNHFYNKKWTCTDLIDKKNIKIIKYTELYLGFNTQNLKKVECFYKD